MSASDEPPSASAGAPADGLRVLVAEDDRVQQLLISTHLEACGCQVDVAEDGQEALALWREHHHVLVITDCRMPRMNGYDLARALRAEPGGQAVVLVGTSADVDDAPLARASGMERLIQKPLSAVDVARLCAQVVR
jgi:CheY-like chemotaxis protein